MMLQNSNTFSWSEKCYNEVQELGIAAGFTFEEFVKKLGTPLSVRGSCSTYPVLVEDSTPEPSSDTHMSSAWGPASTNSTDPADPMDMDVVSSGGSDGPLHASTVSVHVSAFANSGGGTEGVAIMTSMEVEAGSGMTSFPPPPTDVTASVREESEDSGTLTCTNGPTTSAASAVASRAAVHEADDGGQGQAQSSMSEAGAYVVRRTPVR